MLGLSPLSTLPISTLTSEQAVFTTTRTVYFGTHTFATRPNDALANQMIDGRIMAGLRLRREIKTVERGQFGGLMDTSFGEIQLANNDGGIDFMASRYTADGRPIRLKIGAKEINEVGREVVKSFNTFATVYTTVAGSWLFEHDILRLRLESLTNKLNDKMQPSVYAGSGGEQGTSDMAGRTMPIALGRCPHVPAQSVDPSTLTYQLHTGPMQEVISVFDAGVSIPFDTNYAHYTALAAATIPAGKYATSLLSGHIRLGTSPVGQITADVRGDIDNVNLSYVGTSGSIIRMVLRDYGGLTSAELDLTSFNNFVALQTGSFGLFLPAGDQSTVLEVVERLAFQAGAVVGQDRSGLFRIFRLDPPGETPHWLFDDRNITKIERIDLPYLIPWKSWSVGYNVNFAVQTDADLAGSVTQARRQFLKTERRYGFASNSAVALYHGAAGVAPSRESFWLTQAEAENEAERLSDFYSYGRAMYSVIIKDALFSIEIGQVARITYNRFDLDAGKNFLIVGIEDDADRVQTEVTCFG